MTRSRSSGKHHLSRSWFVWSPRTQTSSIVTCGMQTGVGPVYCLGVAGDLVCLDVVDTSSTEQTSGRRTQEWLWRARTAKHTTGGVMNSSRAAQRKATGATGLCKSKQLEQTHQRRTRAIGPYEKSHLMAAPPREAAHVATETISRWRRWLCIALQRGSGAGGLRQTAAVTDRYGPTPRKAGFNWRRAPSGSLTWALQQLLRVRWTFFVS